MNMGEILACIVVLSLIIQFVHGVTREGMPLDIWLKIAYDQEKEIRTELFNPVAECVCCMASFWSCMFVAWYWSMNPFYLYCFSLGFSVLAVLGTLKNKTIDLLVKILYFCSVIVFLSFCPSVDSAFIIFFGSFGLNRTIEGLNIH